MPTDIVADATSPVKAHIAAVQRGCASLSRIVGAADKWGNRLGDQGLAALRASTDALGSLIGMAGARLLPDWL